MSFRLAIGQSLFLCGLTLGALPLAQAQSAERGQQILFSTPEGQVVSNTAAPVTQAPDPEELEGLPDEAPPSLFKVHMPLATPMPLPLMPQQDMPNAQEQDPLDPMGQKKILTPSEIMGVPTMQQIFGLPDSSVADGFKNPTFMANAASTNIISSGESSSEDPTWAKMLAGNPDENALGAAKTEKSRGLMGGFFNGPQADDIFGDQAKDAAAASAFGSASADQTTAAQSPFDSSLAGGTFASSTPALSTPNAAVGSGLTGLNPPSPFALPQSSLQTLPQLPTLPSVPSVPGQRVYTPAPAVPSWEPKPAPWLSSVPPPGTMQPRKF